MNLTSYQNSKPTRLQYLKKIPTTWELSRIKFIADLNPTKSEIRHLPLDSEVTFLPMENIGEQGSLDTSRSKPLSTVLDGYTYVAENDVMIAKITPCFENGKGAIARNLKNGVGFATTEIIPMRCKKSNSSRFLYYILSSSPFRNLAKGSMYGAGGQKRVSDNFAANFKAAIPPEEEQNQIATFLDRETAKIDRLIEKQKKLITILKEKRQAVISHAVTKGLNPNAKMKDSGVEWLGKIPEGWQTAKLKNISIPIVKKKYISNQFVIALENIKGGTGAFVKTDSQYSGEGIEFKEGDILFGKLRPYLSKVFNCDREGVAFGDLLVYRPANEVKSRFLYYMMISNYFISIVNSSTYGAKMPRANPEFISNIPVAIPTANERMEIVAYLNEYLDVIEKIAFKVEEEIALLKERRTALISAAVTGKIDVRHSP